MVEPRKYNRCTDGRGCKHHCGNVLDRDICNSGGIPRMYECSGRLLGCESGYEEKADVRDEIAERIALNIATNAHRADYHGSVSNVLNRYAGWENLKRKDIL